MRLLDGRVVVVTGVGRASTLGSPDTRARSHSTEFLSKFPTDSDTIRVAYRATRTREAIYDLLGND
jgi:hypothetical protein